MTDKKTLLELRSKMTKKRPLFSRKDNNKKARIEDNVWRKARGCDNKQRLKKKGHKKTPRMGFRGPALVRGLHVSGLEQVIVHNKEELHKLNHKEQGVLVSGKTGNRKKVEIIAEAKKLGLTILNMNPDKKVEKIHTQLKLRKEQRAHRLAEAKKSSEHHKKDGKDAKDAKPHHEAQHDAHHDKKEEHKAHEHLDAEAQKKHEEEEKNKVLHNKQ